jgi:hypothetical protein
MESDPNAVTDAIDRATDAFEYRSRGTVEFEAGVEQDSQWQTQLTKACRYLEACRTLRRADGFDGAVVELCFGAVERTLEAYVLQDTDDDLADFRDHEAVYDRATQRGLFERETAAALQDLYRTNRTEHYYGGAVPTAGKADAMYGLAEAIHEYVTGQIRTGGVCLC